MNVPLLSLARTAGLAYLIVVPLLLMGAKERAAVPGFTIGASAGARDE